MTKKKQLSTGEEFIKKLTPAEKKEFDRGYKELLISEMLHAMMIEDEISVRRLAKSAGISPTIVQELRSGGRTNVSMKSFVKIMEALGYKLVAEKGDDRVPVHFK